MVFIINKDGLVPSKAGEVLKDTLFGIVTAAVDLAGLVVYLGTDINKLAFAHVLSKLIRFEDDDLGIVISPAHRENNADQQPKSDR